MDVNLVLFTPAIALVLYHAGKIIHDFYVFKRKINKIPGFGLLNIGMAFRLFTVPRKDRLNWFQHLSNEHKDGMFSMWLGTTGSVRIQKPEHLEVILRSNTEITKSNFYSYLEPWLGSGLITSTGTKWHHDRKMITPTFHFTILEEYSEVIMDKAAILIECIDRDINIHGAKPFDIFKLCGKAALDIICETAMGVDVRAQQLAQSGYIHAGHTIIEMAANRFFRPWLKTDFAFYRSAMGKKFNNAVKKAHDLCTSVIDRKLRERKQRVEKTTLPEKNEGLGVRKRKAFLDLMLEANEHESNPMTIQEIRDQANTFMFAGHDTTGALVSWTLFSLGVELDIQSKVHEELDEILGDADNRTTLKKLPELKYLERVIKETLRLYPSVTAVSRTMTHDFDIGAHTIPKDALLDLQIYNLHRDPSVWPDPLRFDPDRFLPENSRNRHPYAYIPFSAGARNCIGQKFAMLEVKLIVTQVLRKFSVKSVDNHLTIKKYSEITLRPVDGIFVHMKRRPER